MCAVATLDMWTSYRKSYFGSTIHWIDTESLERQSEILSCKRMFGRHTFDVVATHFRGALESVSASRITTAGIADGGSNIKKAFEVFGAEADPEMNNLLDDVEYEPLDGLLEGGLSLPRLAECGAHKLNLVITKDVQKYCDQNSHEEYMGVEQAVMKKLGRLWTLQNSSVQWSEEIKNRFGTFFKVGCATRWFSIFDAITDFLHKQEAKPFEMGQFFTDHQQTTNRGNERTGGLPEITADDYEFLKEFVQLVQPLADACKIMQNQDNMFWGYHAPVIHKMIDKVNRIQGLEWCDPLKAAILFSIRAR